MSQGTSNITRKRPRAKKVHTNDAEIVSPTTSPPEKMAARTGSTEKTENLLVKLDQNQDQTVSEDNINVSSQALKLDTGSLGDSGNIPPLGELDSTVSSVTSQDSQDSQDTGFSSEDSVSTVIDCEIGSTGACAIDFLGGEKTSDKAADSESEGDSDSDDDEDEDNDMNSRLSVENTRVLRSDLKQSQNVPGNSGNCDIPQSDFPRRARSNSIAGPNPCMEAISDNVKENFIVKAITREILELKVHMRKQLNSKTKKLEKNFNKRVSELDEKWSKQDEEWNKKVSELDAQLKACEEKDIVLDNKIDSEVKKVNVRFETQQVAITKVKKSLDDIKANHTQLKESISSMNNEYSSFKIRSTALSKRTTEVDVRVDLLEKRLEGEKKETDLKDVNLKKKIDSHSTKLTSLNSEIGTLSGRVKKLEESRRESGDGNMVTVAQENQQVPSVSCAHKGDSDLNKSELDSAWSKIEQLEKTLDDMESKMKEFIPAPCDDYPKCIIAYNVHFDPEENLHAKCEKLIRHICPDALPVVDCMRLGEGTINNPPMCKIAVDSVAKKVLILKNRQSIKSDPEFSNVTMRPSRSFIERRMRSNFATMGKSIPGLSRKLRMTSHSLLVERGDTGVTDTTGERQSGDDMDGDYESETHGRRSRGGSVRGRSGRGGRNYARGDGRGRQPRSGGPPARSSGSRDGRIFRNSNRGGRNFGIDSDTEFPSLNSSNNNSENIY